MRKFSMYSHKQRWPLNGLHISEHYRKASPEQTMLPFIKLMHLSMVADGAWRDSPEKMENLLKNFFFHFQPMNNNLVSINSDNLIYLRSSR